MNVITNAILKCTYEIAFKNNCLLNESVNGIVHTDRVWWAQAETVVGLVNGYQKNPSYNFV